MQALPVENTLNILLILTDSLSKISMSNLKPQLGLEHLGCIKHIHIWPGHVLQCIVSDREPLSEVQTQGLSSIGEDVEGNLRSFSLHVCDELLQQSCSIDLGSNPFNLSLF